MKKADLGKYGEGIACSFLEKRGYHIVGRNIRLLRTEFDLIAKKDNVLVFVEVKTRRSEQFGSGVESIDYHKQRKLISAATLYQAKLPSGEFAEFRFDVISIRINPVDNIPEHILHIQDAFRGF